MSESYQAYPVLGLKTLFRCPICGAMVMDRDIELHERSHRVRPLWEASLG